MSKIVDFSPVTACAVNIANVDGNTDATVFEGFAAMVELVVSRGLSYKEVRGQWVVSYVATRGCSEKSGQNRFAELCQLVGFVKPQSADAARKTPVKKGARAKVAKPDVVSPASGANAAGITFAQLSTIEREIIEAVLKHQWAMVAALADKAAELPMVDEVHTIDV